MSSSGTDLWNTLQSLNIVTGNVGINVIEGWFDTDSKELIDFLTFVTDRISADNTLTPVEKAEYDMLKEQGKILHGTQYKRAVEEVALEHKGIFEFEENLTQVAVLQNRRNYLRTYKNYLDDVSDGKRRELGEMEKLISTAEDEKLKSNVQMEKAAEICLNLSLKLDDINTSLYKQLNSYESYTTPCYISDLSLDEYTCHYNDIITLLSLIDLPKFGDLPILKSTAKTCRKLKNCEADQYLEQIKHRVFKSMERRRNKELQLAKLREERKFCAQFNLMSLIGFCGNPTSAKSFVKANIRSKQEIYNMWMVDFENKLSKAANKYIDQHTLLMALENLKYIKDKLKYIQRIEENFSYIFSYNVVLHSLFTTNNAHLKKYYENFRAVHKYVINDIQRCNLRIESMADIIREHGEYLRLPFEQKDVLMNCLMHFLSAGNPNRITLKSASNLVSELRKKCQDIEKKLFVDDPEVLARSIRDLDADTKIAKRFITNGPTSEFIAVQYRLCKIFKELDDFFASQNKSVHANVDMLNKTTKQISNNEWLKYKRLLWMYFLLEPKKVQRLINKIEEEVRVRRKENLK